MIKPQPEIIGRRYVVQELIGQGGMGAVYRTRDRLTGQIVALKRVYAPAEKLRFNTRGIETSDLQMALAQEFRVLASLRHPHIISVLDYGFDVKRQPYITMNLLENHQTLLDYARPLPLLEKIDLINQMLLALTYLHRRGILHRDLKPGNVMVADSQVKVLDFGLALQREHAEDGGVVGTLGYMAPEILMGDSPSEASDLYALGIMAYELLVGRHPFNINDFSELIQHVIMSDVDLSPLAAIELDLPAPETTAAPSLVGIIGRLTARETSERYTDASQVILALNEALRLPPPQETIEIRESFLQAARFVGRQAELGQLTAALEQNAGSSWLIGGESGAGKSRLLDELRTQALVRGVQVVRTQTTRERSTAYSTWLDLLRWLCLQEVAISDLEAGVLKTLLPDIETLLNPDDRLHRVIPDAPDLDPQAMQERLIGVITSVLRRQQQPVVVILEDLHWASSESLHIFRQLQRGIAAYPLLLVGSYRDDERPELPQELKGIQLLKLTRLSRAGIEELSVSILGVQGRQPQVVDMLQRETEGNIFFLTEVMRTLAESAGHLDYVGQMTLPANIFAGGVQQIIRYRLERAGIAAQPLLRLAAVAGRELNPALLQATSPNTDAERWLNLCANAAVLEVSEDVWRFSHDKLREQLLADLPATEQQSLHRQIAEAMEQVTPDAVVSLAYHWQMAGNTTKEATYTRQAGDQAQRIGAYQEAISFYTRALALIEPGSLDDAYLRTQLGECYYGNSQLEQAASYFKQALPLVGQPDPQGGLSLALGILNQLGIQARRRMRERLLGPVAPRSPTLIDTLNAEIGFITVCYYLTNQVFPALYHNIRILNVLEESGVSVGLGWSTTSFGYALGTMRLHRLAQAYLQRGVNITRKLNRPSSISSALSLVGLYANGVARWQQSEEALEESIQLAEQIGAWRGMADSLIFVAERKYFLGDFRGAFAVYGEIEQAATRSFSPMQALWATLGFGMSLLRLGNNAGAIHYLNNALEILATMDQSRSNIVCHSMLGLAYLREGATEQALQHTHKAEALIRAKIPTPSSYFLFEGYVGVSYVYLNLLETAASETYLQAAMWACQQQQRYAYRFPAGRPRALLHQGWLERLQGNTPKARKLYEQSIAAAEQYAMPFDEALARVELAKLLPTNDPQRSSHLNLATAIFESLETAWELQSLRTIFD